ncbi:MAG: CRISPR-associated helicase Cas3' [Clostridiales bacterium]|nr:CRISPR-associated helicase Cas3' [Clostridiales bacterium]
MEYLAHIEGERKQFMKEHLEGTARLAGEFAEAFGTYEWGYCCGMLHDIGKYSDAFQEKIRGKEKRVDHSTAGAQLCLAKDGMYGFLSYCIAGHHAGLPDYGSVHFDTASAPTLMGRKQKRVENYEAYQKEIQIPQIKKPPFDPKKVKNPPFSLSVFIRMLYSCLVDADFLDTEYFMQNGITERSPGEPMAVLFEKLNQHISGWLENTESDTVNGHRTEILKHCMEQGKKERGLFRLTVPTGGGKTVASLTFALRHAIENHMERVIYVIPYTSIIEQNAQVFREILGEENVLENHSNVDYESSEELKPMHLAAENWDKPVVVTTNVQFFESLFGNKSSKCRKLHNIANSVIIFDEAQMLPNDYLKPCISMMEELVERYRASLVLCTATQPALGAFFQNGRSFVELCPRMEEQFRFFERVSFQNIGTVTEEDLAERLIQEKQALCIVNTKKRAQCLYRQLEGEGVYHLSTAMYPLHRKRVLKEIRERLAGGERCILISTSLVEAGVDLDFISVYRQIAGVDSMIQAAGRCNREGKRAPEDSVVSVFRFEGKEMTPGQRQQIDVANLLLEEGEDIFSLEVIERYFSMLYRFRGESLDKKRIMDEFKMTGHNFARVGKEFKLIEENTKTIFIPIEEEAGELLQQMKYKGYTKAGMRKAGAYTVQVYDREFESLNGGGMLRPVSEDLKDFYELADESQYTEEMGLNLGVESGMALIL